MAKLIITLNGLPLKEFPLDIQRITIGRNSSNDIALDDETVSGEHAAIQLNPEPTITDLKSTNGTELNNFKIRKEPLKHGDIIKIGNHQLTYIDEQAQDFASTIILDSPVVAEGECLVQGSIKLLNGTKAGEVRPIEKDRTTLGRPGVQAAVIMRHPDGFTLMAVPIGQGEITSQLNGTTLTRDERKLYDGDIIEIAGAQLQFLQQAV
ncbi:MAG: FHA domain-containing protein [Gammaproteobacteria bacterium]|nr:FHA domain-containing protein [Gammaproteobacteria bacterium]